MARKILAVHLHYTEGNITYYVAVQSITDPTKYNAYVNHCPSVSQYMINRTIENGKMLDEFTANLVFNLLEHTYSQD